MNAKQKTITNEERVNGLLNIAANNKLRGSKYIKPSYSALGRMMGDKVMISKDGKMRLSKHLFRYN